MNSLAKKKEIMNAGSEANPLANKLAVARRELIAEFEEYHGLSREDAIARVRDFENPALAEDILRRPLRTTSWHDLDQLAAVDPELATDRWEAIIDDALTDLETGHRAAEAVESGASDCWTRAKYIALREQLASDWHPTNGIELTLIDSMAQAHMMKIFWMQRLIALDALESSEGSSGQLQLPRINAFQAIEQAAAMVDRFDRIFMRALRQLRDFRRYMPTIVVERAEQVNVGQQQLNVANCGDTSHAEGCDDAESSTDSRSETVPVSVTRGGRGVRSPADGLDRRGDER